MSNRFVDRFFSKRVLPYWGVLLSDSVIMYASLLLAHVINAGGENTVSNLSEVSVALALYLVCYMIAFKVFRTYAGVIRYSSFRDLCKVGYAVALGSVMVQALRYFAFTDRFLPAISAKDLALGSLIAVLCMWLGRIVVKMLFDSQRDSARADNVMIAGTRSNGVGLAYSIIGQANSPYRVCGFFTEIRALAGHTLVDKPVFLYDDPELRRYIVDNAVKYILVSPVEQDGFVNDCQELIDWFIDRGIRILVFPNSQEWDGKSDISLLGLRDVSVEDLLPRKKIELDMAPMVGMLNGSCIMITGAAGSIGAEIVRQVAAFNPSRLVLVDQAETPMHDLRLMLAQNFPSVRAFTFVASVTSAAFMEKLFMEHSPQYVFHAAAYKHVPMMEDNPAVAVQNNVRGTRIVADLAARYGVRKFVMISTDKAVNPTSVMGCSKRICEIYCQSLNSQIAAGAVLQKNGTPAVTQFVTTRFGNVLGSNGSVIPIFREQIQSGGPVTVTHKDIVRYFMLISEACRLVLAAGTMGEGGEIFVFEMGRPVRIADLAQRMINLSGAGGTVKIKYVGLRPGEKLYEEVLCQGEDNRPTCHPMIKVASVREYDYRDAVSAEEKLYSLSLCGDSDGIVSYMHEIVPEYQHSELWNQ